MALISWLQNSVLPLWLEEGIDRKNGGFVEALSSEGKALSIPRRAMVQARQIYSLRIARDLGLLDTQKAKEIVSQATNFLIDKYSLSSGAFRYSVSPEGKPESEAQDLYTQAFGLFGLANSFAVNPNPAVEARALSLLKFLYSERALPQGGFTEFANNTIQYEANPHMHLFEAAIAWMSVSKDPMWRKFADDILDLCLAKFVDKDTGMLAEHFDEKWKPLTSANGFVFEPGHQYEWSWLMSKYEQLTGKNLKAVRDRLFDLSEKHGLNPKTGAAYDEVWSDLTVKTGSSRFWTQCERIKCAADRSQSTAAKSGVDVLKRFFETPKPGLWFDRMDESGHFKVENAKASSLYHIIGAVSEYQKYIK